MKSLFDYFHQRQSDIIETIKKIVEIESPSRFVAGSRAVVDLLVAEAEKSSLDLQIERIFADDYGEHLLIRAFPKVSGKQILLLGHTDTVHPVGAKKFNPTRVENGRLYGGGAFDMKANAVLMLEILRAFNELKLQPTRSITILLTCDEEIGSQTGREIVEREAVRAEFCLVGEPSATGKVKTGRKGTGNYTLTAHGVPAHAGLDPERGASAIAELARQIALVELLSDAAQGTTVNVCTFSGGTATNVIPERAECSIDARFTSLSEAARIENDLRKLASFDERVTLELSGALNRPPLERTASVVKLYEAAREIAREFGGELGETQVGGASDGNLVGALGVPVLDGLGISGGGAHTHEEFIFTDDIPPRAALIAGLLLTEIEFSAA